MLETRIPPPVYALLCAGIMWGLDRVLPLADWLGAPWNRLGLVMIAVAVLFDLWSVGLFFRSRTTVNPLKPERASQLVISGMYRFSRNPMYLGMLFALCGWWVYLGSVSPLFMLPVFVWVLTRQQIIPEERTLEEKFGEEYLRYKRQVRRWI